MTSAAGRASTGPPLSTGRPAATRRIVFWGTYDVGKPRARLLVAGAQAAGLETIECHRHVWAGVEDKWHIARAASIAARVLRTLAAYPQLIWRYLRAPAHSAVIVGYPGALDVLVLWPFARLRGVPIVWDVFFSMYDALVHDRRLLRRRSPIARVVFGIEWLSSRAASVVFLDTDAHAHFFEALFGLPRGRVERVWVGAEPDVFRPLPRAAAAPSSTFTALFYGQFIPLHGLETIVRAAAEVERRDRRVRWLLVGHGQEEARIDALITALEVHCIERVRWVPYPDLSRFMAEADVCLGIFGGAGKASRVIPNKVYQALACRRPLITADTPAARELLRDGPCTRLVPPGDPAHLARVVLEMARRKRDGTPPQCIGREVPEVGPREVGRQLLSVLQRRVPEPASSR